MKHYFYYDNSGLVAFYSEKMTECKFQSKYIEPSQEELEKIKNGWKAWIREDRLYLEKTTRIEQEEKRNIAKESLVEKIKKKEVTVEDLSQIILNLLS